MGRKNNQTEKHMRTPATVHEHVGNLCVQMRSTTERKLFSNNNKVYAMLNKLTLKRKTSCMLPKDQNMSQKNNCLTDQNNIRYNNQNNISLVKVNN